MGTARAPRPLTADPGPGETASGDAAPIQAAVLDALRAGISVIPIKADGSKAPALSRWKPYQETRATPDEVEGWFQDARVGLGFVCGEVSGNLECVDFDDRDTYEALKARATEVGLGPLVEEIEVSFLEHTPNGVRWVYRCEQIGRSQKLACRPTFSDGEDRVKTLIEIKAEGGYFIAAPSNGTVHATGRPYVSVSGGPGTIVTLTEEEREDLLTLARSFDQIPRREVTFEAQDPSRKTGSRPGDHFNRDAKWPELLSGWTLVDEHDDESYWRRPGKDSGISATTNYKGSDLFYVFTTSTEFDANRAYDKFAVYAILKHKSDFKAAAKDLAEQGYGDAANGGPQEMGQLSDEEKTTQRDAAWDGCRELALESNILKRFSDSMEGLGVVGERRATQLLFLAVVSRLFPRPVSVAVKGPSSGGEVVGNRQNAQVFPIIRLPRALGDVRTRPHLQQRAAQTSHARLLRGVWDGWGPSDIPRPHSALGRAASI